MMSNAPCSSLEGVSTRRGGDGDGDGDGGFKTVEVRFQLNGGTFQMSFQLKGKVFSKGKSRNTSSVLVAWWDDGWRWVSGLMN